MNHRARIRGFGCEPNPRLPSSSRELVAFPDLTHRAAETPRWFAHSVAKVEPLHQFLTRGVRTWMVMLLGAVSCVLLIACVNLRNLMLVRTTARAREPQVRSTLDASRWDLSRILLLESLVVSLAGAILGVLVAWWGIEAIRAAMPAEVPRAATISVDMRVLAVTGILAILTGMAFGMAPALQLSRPTAPRALGQRDGDGAATPRSKRFAAAS